MCLQTKQQVKMAENEVDDEIDIFSEKFSALKALYSNKHDLSKVQPIDNVAKFQVLLKKSEGTSLSVDQLVKKENKELTEARIKKKKEAAESAATTYLDLAKQKGQVVNPITATKPDEKKEEPEEDDEEEDNEEDEEELQARRPKKQYDNVLTLGNKATGPLGFLKDCMQHRIKVKVWTRNYTSIRGWSEGFVVAFDKHWNIAMEDVTEQWTRKVKRKSFPMGTESVPPEEWIERGPPLMPPPIEIIKKGRKTEECRRYLPQVMIRGEQVVLVSTVSS